MNSSVISALEPVSTSAGNTLNVVFVKVIFFINFGAFKRVQWSWPFLNGIDLLKKRSSIYKYRKYTNLMGKIYGFFISNLMSIGKQIISLNSK